MALVDKWGREIRHSGSRFLEAAHNGGRFPAWPTQVESIRKSINQWDIQTAVSVSRRLYVNNGILRGAIIQKAMFSIGQAWKPLFTGRNKEWGTRAARWLVEEWYPNCDVRGPSFDFQTNLFIDSVSVDRDGDFGILYTEDENGWPLVQRVGQHRIWSPQTERVVTDGEFKGLLINQGVIYNGPGRPIAYRIHEDQVNDFSPIDYRGTDVSVAHFDHVLDPEWYEQGRNLPAFSHGLNQFRSMAQSQEWEEMGMLLTSAIGLIETNPNGGIDPDDPESLLSDRVAANGLETMSLEGGLIRYLRANSGSKIEQMVNHKPGQEWEVFNDRLARIALAGMPWPLPMVWKPEGGGTDTRADILKARMSVADRQFLLLPYARRQVQYAISKAIKLRILPPDPDWLRWGFSLPPRVGIDDGRERKELREDLRSGATTLRAIATANGGDWEEIRDQGEVEADDLLTRAGRLAKKHNVPLLVAISCIQMLNSNQQMPVEEKAMGGNPDEG